MAREEILDITQEKYSQRVDKVAEKLARHPALKRLGLEYAGYVPSPRNVLHFNGLGFTLRAAIVWVGVSPFFKMRIYWTFGLDKDGARLSFPNKKTPRKAILEGITRLDPLNALAVEAMLEKTGGERHPENLDFSKKHSILWP